MNRKIRERLARIIETFSYLLLCAPDLPDEDTTMAQEFARLRTDIKDVGSLLDSADAEQWVKNAIEELDSAERSFSTAELSAGRRLLQASEEHFRNAVNRKNTKPTFVADSDGSVAKTKDGS
jgi:hypothetical protein